MPGAIDVARNGTEPGTRAASVRFTPLPKRPKAIPSTETVHRAGLTAWSTPFCGNDCTNPSLEADFAVELSCSAAEAFTGGNSVASRLHRNPAATSQGRNSKSQRLISPWKGQ